MRPQNQGEVCEGNRLFQEKRWCLVPVDPEKDFSFEEGGNFNDVGRYDG